jgi:hypothetical protein
MDDKTYCTAAELVVLMRKQPSGTKFLLSFRNDGLVIGADGQPTNRCYQMGLSGYAHVTRTEAIEIAKRLQGSNDHLENKGVRIPLWIDVTAYGRNFWFMS